MIPKLELSRQQQRQGKRLAREFRSTLIEAEGDARPSFLWRMMAVGLAEEGAEERAQRRVEIGLRWLARSVLALALTLFVVDTVRHDQHHAITGFLFEHSTLATILFAISVVVLVLLLIDVGTYKPRLFAGCANESAEQFFRELSLLSSDLVDQLETLSGAQITTWREHGKQVEDLLAESNDFLLLDQLRWRVTARMLVRLAALVGSLALAGYGLSGLLGKDLILAPGYAAGLGFPEHLYFTVTSFFTIGFGDVTPRKDLAGYAYLAAIITTFALVVYFVLTDVVASHGEFRVNIRAAAMTLVTKQSAL